jgi:glycosyltransferase involved in cell wall biosynthesis
VTPNEPFTHRIRVGLPITRCVAGAGGVAIRGALGLDPARFEVTVITGQGGPLTERAKAAGMRVLLEPSLVSPISPARDGWALRRLVRLCREHRFDVVHTHSSKAGALGRVAAVRTGVPLVAHTFHGFPFHEFQGRLRHSAYVALERRLAELTDLTFAIGSGVATEAIQRGLARPGHIRTIAPAVESQIVKQTPATRERARRELGIPDSVPLIGTVGRLDYQKAPEILLDAVRRLHDESAHLVWIGDGPERGRVQRLLTQWDLTDRVHLVGERQDVPDLLPALDVFAMASRYEGLPCAIAEAMLCGLPVVATAVNSVPDLVVPGETGLLARPGCPADLASALDLLLADREVAHRLAVAGRNRVGPEFGQEALGDILAAQYIEGLRTSPRQRAA